MQCKEFPASFNVPNLDSAIIPFSNSREQPLAIGAQGEATDSSQMPAQRESFHGCLNISNFDGFILVG